MDMKIVICGTGASGKSSVARILAERLGYRHYSMGDLQRELAKDHNLSITAWGDREAKDDRYDRMIDDRMAEIGRTEDNFVIDAWLGAKFVPDALKVYVDADPSVRALRRLSHARPEEHFKTLAEVIANMQQRESVNRDRWYRYYGFDYADTKNYDLVIDTSLLSLEQVVETILHYIKQQHLNTTPGSKSKAASRDVYGGSVERK